MKAVKEGWLERRNGEPRETKAWRAAPDPKRDFSNSNTVEPPVVQSGGRLERFGRTLDDQALLQWKENKLGLALTGAFVVACLLAIGW